MHPHECQAAADVAAFNLHWENKHEANNHQVMTSEGQVTRQLWCCGSQRTSLLVFLLDWFGFQLITVETDVLAGYANTSICLQPETQRCIIQNKSALWETQQVCYTPSSNYYYYYISQRSWVQLHPLTQPGLTHKPITLLWLLLRGDYWRKTKSMKPSTLAPLFQQPLFPCKIHRNVILSWHEN